MSKSWIQALSVEMRIGKIIEEQAQNGWLFNKPKCEELIKDLYVRMEAIDSKLRPTLPINVKQYGVPVSSPFLMNGKPSKMVTDWMVEDSCIVRGEFSRIFYDPMNLGSDKQVKEFLLNLGWVPTWWNTRKKDSINGKKGENTSPKLNDNGNVCPNLDRLDSQLGKSITLYLKCKHRKGLLEGLLKVLRPDGRIPAEANTIGAATHRMTHKKIVNIPGVGAFMGKEIRSLFIAKEGYSIVGCDSKSNQMRMLCHYLGIDESHEYANAVLNGTKEDNSDAHCIAQQMAGLDKRSEGKTLNYSILFGSGDASLAAKLNRKLGAVRRIKAEFFGNLPELPSLIKQVRAASETRGFLYGLDGRKIWCSQPYKALNYLLQSAEAVYMKYSQAFLYKAIIKEGLDAKFVATIHDEYQLEVLDSHVDRVSELCLWAMELTGKYLKLRVPMSGDVNVGKNWAETH